MARSVLGALLVSTASFYTDYAVGVFSHPVAGRHVVVATTMGRSYLPPTARVLPGATIVRVDPFGGDGWDARFENYARPVDTLAAYASLTRDELKWTAVATSVNEDVRPGGVAFARVGRPVGLSQPEAVPQGLHRLDATWPELGRRARSVPAEGRLIAAAGIVDAIVQATPTTVLQPEDVAMIEAIAAGIGAVTAAQWDEFTGRSSMAVQAASLAGRSIGVSSSAADAALRDPASEAMHRLLLREALLCLRGAPETVALEELVYVALHLGIDPMAQLQPS